MASRQGKRVSLRLGSGAADRDYRAVQAEGAQAADEVASFPTRRGEY